MAVKFLCFDTTTDLFEVDNNFAMCIDVISNSSFSKPRLYIFCGFSFPQS